MRFAALAGLLLLVSSRARADGCDSGMRPLKPEEVRFYAAVRDLARALPHAPGGWTADEPSASTEESLCKDLDADLASGKQHLHGAVAVLFRAPLEPVALEAATSAPPDDKTQQRLNAILEEQQRLLVSLAEAAQRGDSAAGDALQVKIEALSAEAEKLSAPLRASSEAALRAATKDTLARVELLVNEPLEGAQCAAARPIKPTIGQPFRLRCPVHVSADTEVDGETLVLIGPWKAEIKSGKLQAEATLAKGPATVQTIVVRIQADERRAEQLLAGVDLGALRAALR